jgi:small-conductance mechanosensitive channel
MPEKELILLIDALIKQIQTIQESQEKLRQFVMEQIKLMQSEYALKEYVEEMGKDIEQITEKLEEIKETIIKNQEEKFKQTIALQAAILSLILGAFIASFFVPNILHLFGH